MTTQKEKLIAILGPTSSGKTKLAVRLAKIFNGEIVSADSRQVYKGMDVGTGKDLKEYKIKKARKHENTKTIPYHLIDIVSPKSQFSLAQYQKLAYQAINNIIKRGKIPFLVGGTGLYIQAVVDGYQLTDVRPDKETRKQLNKKTIKQLQTLVKKYRIKLNQSVFRNKRRLIRAIEIKKTKKQKNKKTSPHYNCLLLGIKYPKKVIDERIDKRLIQRLEKQGMIKEVKKLRKSGVSWKRLDDFGLEYRYVARYLKGELTYDQMVKQLSIAIHQFAKRQMTWFKRDRRIKWIKNYKEAEKLIKNFFK